MNEVIRDIFKKDFDTARQDGIDDANKRVASDMLRDNYPLSDIEKISMLSEDTIRNLAKSLGILVLYTIHILVILLCSLLNG